MAYLSVMLLVCLVGINGLPLSKRDAEEKTEAMMYLMRFGYMDHVLGDQDARSASLLSEETYQDSLKMFQRFAGIPETGIMDEETEKMMKMPRCGVKDIVGYGVKAKRKKRYALQGSRWRVKNLTYKISKYPSGDRLSKEEVNDEIRTALEVWAEYTDLTFTQKTSGRVHIEIRFERREHGDGDPFDGQGGTLAHAFFPVFGGDAHFDDQEFWTKGTFLGTNLLQTAAHEFGHSLGLSHSDTSNALMAPFYRGFEKKVRLEKDDINGIQELYGEKTEKPHTNTVEVDVDDNDRDDDDDEHRDDEELCNDATVDAIVTTKDKTTYTFKGRNYWKLTSDSIAAGYPRSIPQDWDGLPPNLDAAFTWTNGKTYFFKDSQYWRFTDQSMDSGYPKDISKGFEGIPDRVDAAFVWSGNEKIYFFKGDQYWKFDPEKKPPVSSSYPKPISNWKGIPSNIDDALRYSNGYTYFFKKGQYWRFNDTGFQVDSADPDFPRPAGFWWFGCSTINQGKEITSTSTEQSTITSKYPDFNDWFWWPNDRADVPISMDEDYEGDKGEGRSGAWAWAKKFGKRVRNVFSNIFNRN